MKTLGKKLAVLLFLSLFLLPFAGRKETRAEVNYLFTGFAVPEGMPGTFRLDDATLDILRQNPALAGVFVASLAEKYNTPFAVLDQNAENAYLTGVLTGETAGGDHIPVYMPVAAATAQDPLQTALLPAVVNMDINGGSYIDINITTQTLVLFRNGIPAIVTPVVTGNARKGLNTPQGLFAVQYKQLDRTLKGEDYESFVHYWMRIVNNVGIHDASWRSSFGGEIYKTNGSHGCINVPPSVMPEIYGTVPEGTPVFVHS